MELHPLLNLLITKFTIIESGLFLGREHGKLNISGSIPGIYWQNGGIHLI